MIIYKTEFLNPLKFNKIQYKGPTTILKYFKWTWVESIENM